MDGIGDGSSDFLAGEEGGQFEAEFDGGAGSLRGEDVVGLDNAVIAGIWEFRSDGGMTGGWAIVEDP